MLGRIIEASVRNKYLVILATVFLAAWGIWAMYRIPLDAIPDLSDVQVIVFTEYPGQGPRIVEEQVTYPLTTAMLAVPKTKVVRGYSFFGLSFVYIIFADGTDIYWARSRVLEYLNFASKRLPAGVTPTLGPDATGVGWVYEYALVDKTGKNDLAKLRSLQDWYLRYELTAVDGVSEVASIGGMVKQYQVVVHPDKLAAYGIPIQKVRMAVQRSNNDVGGRLVEMGETEFMVRGLGYIKTLDDLRNIPLSSDRGTPVLLRDVADVRLGPELRRGIADLNGEGDVAGGVVIMRFGENALTTIQNVKKKLADLKAGLPEGVEIVPVYDRSGLIERAIETLKGKLLEESLVVALVCILFLLHFRSALVAILTLPLAVLMAFIVMYYQGLNANIMSLSGIAIAIGAMVDAAIIMIENMHKHMEHDSGERSHWDLVVDASKEVGPTLFYSLLVITVSFLPVFTLEAQEGRLFKPLAFTKTYSMAAAALLSITIVPIWMGFFIRGKIRPEERNPINRFLIRLYHPVLDWALKHKKTILIGAVSLIAVTAWPVLKIGSEFMPPLYEGDLLYMPTTLPGISITKAKELLQQTDRIIRTFPEVHHVFGKIGRAETATDPAPLTMLETTITLKPEKEWRKGMTHEKLVEELNASIRFPGVTNAWTMPIKTRTDMLATGIKTPVGIKILGDDLDTLVKLGEQVEAVVSKVPGTLSAYAERVTGGNYFDYNIRREEAARYGLTVGDVQDVIMSAMGGMNVTTTVEGLERYPVNVRYPEELRDNIESMRRILVPTPGGAQVPLGQLADISIHKGPSNIKSENARRTVWIYVDIRGIDLGTYVKNAQEAVRKSVKMPVGYSLLWSGQFEYMERAKKRLMVVIPLTLLIVFLIIYMNTKSLTKTTIVLLAVPFSLVGAFWFIYLLGFNLSVAVWVGIIALAGLDAETGVVMLLYLDVAYESMKRKKLMNTMGDLKEAIVDGAVKRIRPKVMTASVIIAGLIPIMWSSGTGSDVMKRIAAPMVGGVVTSVIMELLVYPVIYEFLKQKGLDRSEARTSLEAAPAPLPGENG
ncbi:MAG: cation transporter [Deltaproteobacteria bacterium CG2_30_66_27]|nr:MAG: cation transporter [Deltaproteobacteria bacterium CG2_30_66_27]PJB32282.1 MAG: CusA/CzcA family heavy metal efflux RND transporter [Deltaproteobacteria bacterium CG_4_9_14_3_um_filter_65_9]